MSLLLALNRRIVQLDRDLRGGAWIVNAHHTTAMLHGPIPALLRINVGIVGLGRIGKAVAERARPFGLRILAADPFILDEEVEESGAKRVSFEELLAASNMITLHCPLQRSTEV